MKLKILIILLLIAVLVSSCARPKEVGRYKLTEADKQMIPYKLGENISFIDSLGQHFVLTVTNDYTAWSRWDFDHDAARELEYVSFEYRVVHLQSKSNNLRIELNVYGYYGSENHSIRVALSLFRDRFYFFPYGSDGQFFSDTNILEINNKIYNDVVEYIIYQQNYPYEDILPMRLLYNKTYGILQFEQKDKVIFSIDN